MSNEIKEIIIDDKATEAKWKKYFISKNTELDTEYADLTGGTKDRQGRGYRKAGYNNLRDFYDGDQWKYVPEGGKPMRTYNFCRTVVNNYTAFMTNEPVDIDVPSADINDEVEVLRSEMKEKALKDILKDNQFNFQFEASVQNGTLLGDSVIIGPFYDEKKDRIWFKNVKRPENVRMIWKDSNYDELFGYIHHYFLSMEQAYTMFHELAEKAGVTFSEDFARMQMDTQYNQVARRMTRVLDCWTDKVHMLIVGNQVLEFERHDYGFVSAIHVPNTIHPEEPYGTSDIEDLLDPQTEYNEKSSDLSEVITQTAFPWIFGTNLKPAEVQSGQLNLVDLGDEAQVFDDPRAFRSGDLNTEIQRRLSNLFQISGLNENIFGGSTVRAVTGRALSVLMQTVNNRVKGRQERWTKALQELFKNIFILMEKKTKQGKDLVGGYYHTDIFFPGTLMRNITDEINKFNAKLQSQETTMKNLGVPSPKDEKKLMKKEMEDEITMIETSRNPQLQLAVQQQKEQALAEKVAGNKPVLREDENDEEQPKAQAGAPQQSAQSAKGAVKQSEQRRGNAVTLESEG